MNKADYLAAIAASAKYVGQPEEQPQEGALCPLPAPDKGELMPTKKEIANDIKQLWLEAEKHFAALTDANADDALFHLDALVAIYQGRGQKHTCFGTAFDVVTGPLAPFYERFVNGIKNARALVLGREAYAGARDKGTWKDYVKEAHAAYKDVFHALKGKSLFDQIADDEAAK